MDKTDAERKILGLRRELERHNQLYYVQAAPEISDREYDALYRELVELESRHPELIGDDSPTRRVGGQPLEGFTTRPHAVPMLSLDNTYSVEELRRFDKYVADRLPGEKVLYVVEPKIDGVSLSLRYEEGALVMALTRGNGREGDDVTHNVRTIPSIPLRLRSDSPPAVFEARGEVFITREDFSRLNQHRRDAGVAEFVNPRNATAGSLKLLDPREVAKRPLTAIFYGQGEVDGLDVASQRRLLEVMAAFGLRTSQFAEIANGWEEMQAVVERLAAKRLALPYDIDGAVIKVDDFGQRAALGFTAKAPSWAKAFKYAALTAETVLRAITVQVGRTGILTPVAELEPVFLAGSTISRATLHNEDEIRRKDIRIGDTVVVEKAGEVIPAVVEVVVDQRPEGARPFDLYRHVDGKCPACGGGIERDPQFVAWRCLDLLCPAQLVRRLRHFTARNALDIEAVGQIVAEKLVETNWVGDPLDLFSLTVDQLAPLNLGSRDEPRVFGAKNAQKMVDAVQRARELPLARWLFAIGIPDVGVATAIEVAAVHENFAALADSAILRDSLRLLRLQEEARRVNPRSAANRVLDERQKETLERRLAEINQSIGQIGRELAGKGLARTKKAGALQALDNEYLPTFGDRVASSILAFFAGQTGRDFLRRLRDLGIDPQGGEFRDATKADNPLAGKTVVMTGSLQALTRDQAREKLLVLGANVTTSVSANTDCLLAGENAGSKLTKARQLGIDILSEEAFLAILAKTEKRSPATPSPAPDAAQPADPGKPSGAGRPVQPTLFDDETGLPDTSG